MEKLLHLPIYGLKEENKDTRKRYVCLDNCYMYVSPGEHNKLAYPTEIPIGTVLECKYSYKYFTYTSYNGVSGWIIDIAMMTGWEQYAKVARESEANIITTNNTILYSQPLNEKNYETSITIPQNTEFHVSYMYEYGNYGYEGFFMVEYNNQTGWINVEDCATEVEEKYTFNKTVKFSEDIIVDGNVVIKKGETVNLTSKYVTTGFYGQIDDVYYFRYKNYNFWSWDLGIYYPEETYIILFKGYKDLPINKKLKVKYCIGLFSDDYSNYLTSAYYIEYNNKIYVLRYDNRIWQSDFTGMVINEMKYDVLKVNENFDLIKSPFDNTVITNLNSGDIICQYETTLYDKDKEYGNYSFYCCITQDGTLGYVKNENKKTTTVAYDVSKEELSKYFTINEKNEIVFLNNNSSGEYAELLKYDLSGDYIVQKNITMYANFFEEKDREKVEVPVNSEISMLGTAAIMVDEENKGPYYYISYEDKNGYAIIESGDIEKKIEESSGDKISSGEDDLNIYEIQDKKKEASLTTICILCICGAIIIAITTIVTIKLINKKSQNNNDEDNKDKKDE